jgi:cephalosporin hydroxylase
MYPALVTAGSYLVVEDTFISRYDCQGDRFQDGSTWEALQRWLPDHPEFEYDPGRDKFLLSMNPGGWLRRKS